MKIINVLILFFWVITACNKYEKSNDVVKQKYQVKSEKIILIDSESRIGNGKKMSDGNYLTKINTENEFSKTDEEIITQIREYFLKITPQGDTLDRKEASLNYYFLTDFIEYEDYYYAVTTDITTMGGYTKDFLNKCDKNWGLIWKKEIDKPKYPAGNTILAFTEKKEILLISDRFFFKPNDNQYGIEIMRFDMNGILMSEKLLRTPKFSKPISIIHLANNEFLLTAVKTDIDTKASALWTINLTNKGDTLFSKTILNFYPQYVLKTTKGELLFLGEHDTSKKSNNEPIRNIKAIMFDDKWNLKWEKILPTKYKEAGNIIETKDGLFLFASIIDKNGLVCLLELDRNGNIINEKTFDYELVNDFPPTILQGNKQIVLLTNQEILKSQKPKTYRGVIKIITLTE